MTITAGTAFVRQVCGDIGGLGYQYIICGQKAGRCGMAACDNAVGKAAGSGCGNWANGIIADTGCGINVGPSVKQNNIFPIILNIIIIKDDLVYGV